MSNLTNDANGNGVGNVQSTLTSATTIAPNDATDLVKKPTKGLYVGTTGTLKVDMADGTTVTFTAIAVNVVHPLSVRRIYATGTSATNIIALY